uniref:Integrase catalytic domain-containing protein n=1 Tax=Trichuris muris TaxID=70415 RepID=A0A5S6R6C0_TRIMR
MAELDAVIKGLNLAVTWKMRWIELMTDSTTVHKWISDALSGRARMKTKAASEILIRRRIGIVLSLVKECALELSVSLVSSRDNKADAITRVPQRWLTSLRTPTPACAAVDGPDAKLLAVRIHHDAGHPGVQRTFYFAKRVCPFVTKRQVQQIVADCAACQSIDPAAAEWKHGRLDVEKVWHRLAMDITHVRGRSYLTLIDCGPSRFTIWRLLRLQTTSEVVEQLEAVFHERGAPEELLIDNDTAFRSRTFRQFATKWDVRLRFRCAHVPSGNGIKERCHRSVKVIAARKECSVSEAVYLYNVTPRDDRTANSTPASGIYKYDVRLQGTGVPIRCSQQENVTYAIGDPVWVKPPGGRCDQRYCKGMVTNLLSNQAVEVDGVQHHVREIRRRAPSTDTITAAEDDVDDEIIVRFPRRHAPDQTLPRRASNAPEEGPRRSIRIRTSRAFRCCDGTAGGV